MRKINKGSRHLFEALQYNNGKKQMFVNNTRNRCKIYLELKHYTKVPSKKYFT